MDFTSLLTKDTTWWLFALPHLLGSSYILNINILITLFITFLSLYILTWTFSQGGVAWLHGRNHHGCMAIPGARGLPIVGHLVTLTRGLAHRSLASMAWQRGNKELMAFSLGSTPVVVASDPQSAKEILTSVHFADRPLKLSAKSLMFGRAIGFAPNGTYWRLLRRIASSHLFSPKRIAAHEAGRQKDCVTMMQNITNEEALHGVVCLRKHLQLAALNNIMGSVFGKRYEYDCDELEELTDMVKEGFELLGAFNWCDYLPWLSYFYDPYCIKERCAKLVPRVRKFVKKIIEEHRVGEAKKMSDNADFVDVLLSLNGEEKLQEDDMIAVLWEMIFRGTDTTALLTEWVMAELVLHPEMQEKLYSEINSTVTETTLTDAHAAKLPYLHAIIKETLRMHPPGPLLSWARLSTSDVQLSNGMVIPVNTTAMVNMWAITHDPQVWEDPQVFRPERFMGNEGGIEVDVRGSDLRLAPFGAGRRTCPGKNLGLVTVGLWVAKLVKHFKWVQDEGHKVDLSEVLKLSCEMKYPLHAKALDRNSDVIVTL